MAAAKRVVLDFERRSLVQLIQARAEAENWSWREVSRRAGLSRTTLTRAVHGKINLAVWLPQLRTVAARLNPPVSA